jgi:outer membrane protease
VACRVFAAIAWYIMKDADTVTRLAETLAKMETSFPAAAGVANARFREQVLRESGGGRKFSALTSNFLRI